MLRNRRLKTRRNAKIAGRWGRAAVRRAQAPAGKGRGRFAARKPLFRRQKTARVRAVLEAAAYSVV